MYNFPPCWDCKCKNNYTVCIIEDGFSLSSLSDLLPSDIIFSLGSLLDLLPSEIRFLLCSLEYLSFGLILSGVSTGTGTDTESPTGTGTATEGWTGTGIGWTNSVLFKKYTNSEKVVLIFCLVTPEKTPWKVI